MHQNELSPDEKQLMAAKPRGILDHFQMTPASVRARLDEVRGSVARVHEWGVAAYFLVNKPQEQITAELQAMGLQGKGSDELLYLLGREGFKNLVYRRVEADEDGFMTFPSRTVVLGHTDAVIKVPRRTHYRMHDRFVDKETREELPLLTNVTAPGIQTKNTGPQTYEIYNTTDEPLRINVHSLACLVDEMPMSTRAQNGNGTSTYGKQDTGVIRLGDPYAKHATAK